MTTKSVEVQETVEKEVNICDECGLGDDAGTLREITVFPGDSLHLHEGCVDSYREDEHITWGEAHNQSLPDDATTNALLFNTVTLAILHVGLILIFAAVFISSPLNYVVAVVGILLHVFMLSNSHASASDAVELKAEHSASNTVKSEVEQSDDIWYETE